MFRRFRRKKDKNSNGQNLPEDSHMLPSPEQYWDDEQGDENEITQTAPLKAVREPINHFSADNTVVKSGVRPESTKKEDPPTIIIEPEAVALALEEFINAPKVSDSREALKKHPELLSNTAMMLLTSNINRVYEQVGPSAAKYLERYQRALQIAQREGIDKAFKDEPEELFTPDLDELLQDIESPEAAAQPRLKLRYLEEALNLASRDQLDELWAALQSEIGMTAVRLRNAPDGQQLLEHAIESLFAALQIFTFAEYPYDWGAAQYYLGQAYLYRESDDRKADLEQSIEALTAALRVRTRQHSAKEWAAAQETLGAAYYQQFLLGNENAADAGIAAYELALTVRDAKTSPAEWANDYIFLGNIWGQRTSGDRNKNLEHSIASFETALTALTRQKDGDRWALAHHNLGVAYMDRIEGARAENIERAIEHYEQELALETLNKNPVDWANTLNNLGNALRERKYGSREDNIKRAVSAYRESLSIRRRDAFPLEHRRTARNLGSLLFEQGKWEEAHSVLTGALAASDTLYAMQLGTSKPGQRVRDHAELVALDAYCLARMNRPRDAAIRLEKGHIRITNEALERDESALQKVSTELRIKFHNAQAQLWNAYSALQKDIAANTKPVSAELPFHTGSVTMVYASQRSDEFSAALRSAQDALLAAITQIQKQDPDFLLQTITFQNITKAVKPDRPMVYIVSTESGSFALCISAKETAGALKAFWAENVTEAELAGIAEVSQHPQMHVQTELGALPAPNALEKILGVLGKDLITPLAEHLRSSGTAKAVICSLGAIAAAPLHAAPVRAHIPQLDDDGVESDKIFENPRFLDYVEVSYISSAQQLLRSETRAMMNLRNGAAIFGNPQPAEINLMWSEHEAEAIAQVVSAVGQPNTLLIRRRISRSAALKALKERAYAHFACPCGFFPERPAQSFIQLSGAEKIVAKDVLHGDAAFLGVRLAVLSAGQSALSNASSIDESVSLAATLQVGGAAAVAGSLWPASDLATLLLMRRFAQFYLNDGHRPAQALRNAQRWLRSLTLDEMMRTYADDLSRDPDMNLSDMTPANAAPFAHPIYWSGFIIQGI